MKPKYILLSVFALLLLGGAYYYYTQVFNRPQADAWSFVPADAVWVYETSRAAEAWENLQKQPAGEVLQGLPFYQRLMDYQQELDSASGGTLKEFLQNRQLLSSVHITAKNSFDYLFYVPLAGPEDYEVLRKVLDAYHTKTAYRYGTRTYHKVDIEEFTRLGTKERFSFILHNNYFVGSFTPFLVEDVIRQLGEAEKGETFQQQNKALFQLSQIDEDEGNLYVNGRRLGSFLKLFLQEAAFPDSFPLASKLDLAVKPEGILLNGYTLPDSGSTEAPYLQSLRGEEPQPLGMAHLLPLRAATLQFYGFRNGTAFHSRLLEKGAIPQWKVFVAQFPQAAALPETLGNSLALARWKSPGEEQEQQLLYIHLDKPEEAFRQWQSLASSLSQASGDSLYREEFGPYTLTQFSHASLPEAFLGGKFAGFEESFFVVLDDYLVLSNSLLTLKSLLLDIEQENTWRKSVPVYQFLERTNQELNWGYYVQVEKVWKQLVEAAAPEWKAFLEKQGPYLRQFNHFALQLSALDNELFYTNALLEAFPQEVKDLRQIRLSTLYTSSLGAPVASRPMLLRSSMRKQQEVLVQDSLYRLHLLDGKGDSIAGDSLDGPLVAKVFQLDVQKNGQLDYLAVTPKQLYLYDASFSLRPDFPRDLPAEAVAQWASVLDYNGSKTYRILVAEQSGSIYMFDTQGNMLEGWQPRVLEGALNAAPGHIRVRGKDVLYAFQQKGLVHMLNRRGNSYKGFPLDLKDSLLGPVLTSPGADFASTRFTTITKGGELIAFNLLGEISSQKQLFKPEPDAFFRLLPAEKGNAFLIVRQSANRLSVLDAKGELLFEQNYLGTGHILVQYFIFGTDKEIIAITDPEESFTFLYDRQGNLLNEEPLNSCCPISILFQEKENTYHVFKGFGEQMSHLKGGN